MWSRLVALQKNFWAWATANQNTLFWLDKFSMNKKNCNWEFYYCKTNELNFGDLASFWCEVHHYRSLDSSASGDVTQQHVTLPWPHIQCQWLCYIYAIFVIMSVSQLPLHRKPIIFDQSVHFHNTCLPG
jgi:hypothetical protein